jgi:predicted DNA-binding transcriptional regulator AlpA
MKTTTTTATLIEQVSPDQFMELIVFMFRKELEDFKKSLTTQNPDELLSRPQVLELLQINASTLWHYQNKGRVTVYKFGNKCFYKRAELLAGLIPLKK